MDFKGKYWTLLHLPDSYGSPDHTGQKPLKTDNDKQKISVINIHQLPCSKSDPALYKVKMREDHSFKSSQMFFLLWGYDPFLPQCHTLVLLLLHARISTWTHRTVSVAPWVTLSLDDCLHWHSVLSCGHNVCILFFNLWLVKGRFLLKVCILCFIQS